MLNHFDDRIELVKVEHKIVDGSNQRTTESVEVWADQKSVGRTEYYLATQAGIKTDVIFSVNVSDYNGQQEVVYNNEVYDVGRTYQKSLDRMELTCVRRV